MATATHYKLCPSCRTEYTFVSVRCADCDVELVQPDALEAEPAPLQLPAASQLDCVRVAPLDWIRALSDGLEQGGISHRIEPATAGDAPEGQSCDAFGDVQLFGLYVEPAAGAAARKLDGAIAARVLPEEAPELADGEQDACPACGTPLSATAIECPECELVFG